MKYEYQSWSDKEEDIILLEMHQHKEDIDEYIRKNYNGKKLRELDDDELFLVASNYLD